MKVCPVSPASLVLVTMMMMMMSPCRIFVTARLGGISINSDPISNQEEEEQEQEDYAHHPRDVSHQRQLQTATAAPATVLITEIMYDPSACADTDGEWVELYNNGNTAVDLWGWTVSDASGSGSVTLSSSIVLQPQAYHVLGRTVNGCGGLNADTTFSFALNNAGGDTLTLQDNTGAIIDAHTYGSGDAASGFTTQRAVDAATSVPLTTWEQGPDGGSPRAGYASSSSGGGGGTADVKISEIMYNPSDCSDSAGEWIELYNAGTAAADISAWTVQDKQGGAVTLPSPYTLAAGGYYILGSTVNGCGGLNADMTFGFALNNSGGGDTVTLKDATGSIVDEHNYKGGDAAPGYTVQRSPINLSVWEQGPLGGSPRAGYGAAPPPTPSTLTPTASPTTVAPTLAPTSIPTASPTTLMPTTSPTTASPTPPVVVVEAIWINEFHYDNDSTDTNEFVEVAFTTGLPNLASYKIVLYNGNGGASYGTYNLPSTPTATAGDVSFATIMTPSIQNGGPDGIALIDTTTSSVVEFLSYEGTMVATDGEASGLTSTDVGVSETTSTPVGFSLQRTGTGCSGADFTTWANPQANTADAVNAGQTINCSGGPGPSPPTPSPPTPSPPGPTPTPPPPPTSPTTTRAYSGYSLELSCGTSAGYATRYAYELVGPDLGNEPRPSSFYYDNALPQECQQISRSSYSHPNCGTSGRKTNPFCYDRGHLVMANHMDNDPTDIYESNMMTNVLPQATGFNQAGGAWIYTEEVIECQRDVSNIAKQVIFGGALFYDSANDYFLSSHGIPTPEEFWKVIVRYYTDNSTPDVIAWVMPNVYTATNDLLDSYLRSVAQVQALTGDAMPELPATYSESAYASGVSWVKASPCDLSRLRYL